ncbi:UbiX family flavin prenyltransferase [Paracoccus marinaquae]|uniref:Flavin prenyltransferase UbiX n=1 Tax=Paracoccus marinaquae TaxID=2841926 RepID=A0ABS6AG10_9RHOB|nr:UbiX family flavin prenyltransferase [Paracoccus marinaquae]MBU3029534.1 UbiX family flavin prenyltransferase [Paracoccus marinaquae]
MTRVVLGVSGASGAALALDCAAALVRAQVEVDLVLSVMAERTLAEEIGPEAQDRLCTLATRVHPRGDLGAEIASGSCPVSGMIVAPCSMRSLAAIAHGFDDNLLTRAAGVQLKERRPLVLLTREAPLTLAHLKNMQAAAEMGAVILPPVPAFYLRPASLAEVTAQIAARAVDLLRLAPPLAQAWSPADDPRD